MMGLKPNRSLARKALITFLGTVFFLTLAANVYIDLDYAYTMPKSPQAGSGRVYRIMVNHGTLVYVTRQEFARANFVFHDLFNVGTFCFFSIFFLTVDLRELWRRARAGPRRPGSQL